MAGSAQYERSRSPSSSPSPSSAITSSTSPQMSYPQPPKRHNLKLALISVCILSVGSHFGSYLLGPLKSKLHQEMHTSNSQFSILIASFNLNSTWTPLVAGLLIARFGTVWSSIVTSGLVLGGQIVLLAGVSSGNIVIMSLGLFIFGLGVSPLAVTQETLLSHLAPSSRLGLSLALGLLLGKASSFIASLVSLPLANTFGEKAPFIAAVLLAGLSFGMNLLRLAKGWGALVTEEGIILEKEEVKKVVRFGGIARLGDVFWVYIVYNLFAGAIWQPFLHLAPSLLQARYEESDSLASLQGSMLLAGAIVLYPLVGYLCDHKGGSRLFTALFRAKTKKTDIPTHSTSAMTFRLLLVSAILTLSGYSWLNLPPSWTRGPVLGMLGFAIGHGMAPLLLVVIVPRILPKRWISTGLGAHKSLEMSASTFSQTLAGLWLDHHIDHDKESEAEDTFKAGASLLRVFLWINVVQVGCAGVLWMMEMRRRIAGDQDRPSAITQAEEYERLPLDDIESPGALDGPEVKLQQVEASDELESFLAQTDGEVARGRIFFVIALSFVVVVWLTFLGTAWNRLR